MSTQHPYRHLESTRIWKAIDKAIGDLVDNGDLTETTDRNYIVGYLTQRIIEGKLTAGRLRAVRQKISKSLTASQELVSALGDLDVLNQKK